MSLCDLEIKNRYRQEVRLRRSHSRGRTSPVPRVGFDPFPPGGLSPAAPQGRCRGQDRCRGLLIINRGQTKEFSGGSERTKTSLSRELQPPGVGGAASAVGGIRSIPRPRRSTVPGRGGGVPGASPPSPSAAFCPSATRG